MQRTHLYRWLSFTFLAHLLSSPSALIASDINVESWFLGTRVDYSATGQQSGQVSAVVMNPFEADHLGAIENSTAQTQLSFYWNSQGHASFLIEAQHAAAGSPPIIEVTSSGNIWLTPSVESILTLDAVYDYALGSGNRRLDFNLAAVGGGGGIGVQHVISPIFGDPPVGQLVFHDELLLQPGIEYTLQYFIRHLSVSGSADSLSTGNGSVQFSIVPVPEPATALLVLAAAPIALRRRRSSLQ